MIMDGCVRTSRAKHTCPKGQRWGRKCAFACVCVCRSNACWSTWNVSARQNRWRWICSNVQCPTGGALATLCDSCWKWNGAIFLPLDLPCAPYTCNPTLATREYAELPTSAAIRQCDAATITTHIMACLLISHPTDDGVWTVWMVSGPHGSGEERCVWRTFKCWPSQRTATVQQAVHTATLDFLECSQTGFIALFRFRHTHTHTYTLARYMPRIHRCASDKLSFPE